MKITDFDIYNEIIQEKAGITFKPSETYILESRLKPIAKKWGFASLTGMTIALQGMPDQAMIVDILETVTNKTTSFFRDFHPYDYLRTHVMPYLHENRKNERHIKIWCAGVSTGQEAYSIAIMLKEMQKSGIFAGWDISILGTDLSAATIETAKSGIYSQDQVQRGLPITLLLEHFAQKRDNWYIDKKLKDAVTFQAHNLMDDMSVFTHFDIIFCRHVMQRFQADVRSSVINRLTDRLKPDGFIFLGGNVSEDAPPISVESLAPTLSHLEGHCEVYAHKDSIHALSEKPMLNVFRSNF